MIHRACLLYTSDAADDLLCVDLGCRRIIKQKNKDYHQTSHEHITHTVTNQLTPTQT